MKNTLRLLGINLLVGLSLVLPAHAQEPADLKPKIMENYANVVFANYQDTYQTAVELHDAIHTFLDNPSEEAFLAAQDAWKAAREPYGQTEAFRFYGGPIDDADGPEGLLNAWPLDEAYIDYVEGQPEAGVINNLTAYPEITAEVLEGLNEQGAEENISVGYHAIEFLLWGQDFYADSAGQRPYTDYVEGGTAANPERRGEYLSLTADLLVEHLGELVAAWDPAVADNYRAEFLALDPDIALGYMLTGIGVLSKSELSGERMFTAYDNQDQEDEHSCFSDNTHRDIYVDALGIVNVYRGSYTRLDGTVISGASLADLMAAVNPELNDEIQAQLDVSMADVSAIHVPFDQAISVPEYRPAVIDAVFSLQDQGDMFAEAATSLGININTALPE